jgi:hypothetical protein
LKPDRVLLGVGNRDSDRDDHDGRHRDWRCHRDGPGDAGRPGRVPGPVTRTVPPGDSADTPPAILRIRVRVMGHEPESQPANGCQSVTPGSAATRTPGARRKAAAATGAGSPRRPSRGPPAGPGRGPWNNLNPVTTRLVRNGCFRFSLVGH